MKGKTDMKDNSNNHNIPVFLRGVRVSMTEDELAEGQREYGLVRCPECWNIVHKGNFCSQCGKPLTQTELKPWDEISV